MPRKIEFLETLFNKTYFVVVFLLITGLFSSTAIAQISGYMGKRFSIGYGGNIGYAMFSRNSSGSSLFGTSDLDFPEKLFSFNYKHQAHMELVLTNKHGLGLQGSYGITQFKAFDDGDAYLSTIQYAPGYSSSGYIVDDLYAKMKMVTIGIYLKRFNSNTAPIGKYWAYKLSLLRYAADYSEVKFPSDYAKSTIPLSDIYHTSGVFVVSQGTSRVYFNRFLVDSNIEFGLPFVIPGVNISDFYEYSALYYDEKLTKRMNTRLWGNFLFNVNVNVSLLAF